LQGVLLTPIVNLLCYYIIKGKKHFIHSSITEKMKKVLGIILIIVGIVCLPQAFTPSAPETIGGLIGISLITFLPAFFLLRNKKDENENDEKNQ
jgi:hypothetical protein